MESRLEGKSASGCFTVNSLLKTVDRYDTLHRGDHETRRRARNLILEVSKRLVASTRGNQERALSSREGSTRRLRGIASMAAKLSSVLEPVLLRIDESDYARDLLKEFMPCVEEAARYATRLGAKTSAQMLLILKAADTVGYGYNRGLREVYEDQIQETIIPKRLEAPRLLLSLAERRLQEGEYLTSYLLSREATRATLEDLTGAYPSDLARGEAPSPSWRLEDYLGYLMEIGLVPDEQGKELLELFVGEPEHLNARWKKRRDAERAFNGIRAYIEAMDSDEMCSEWL